MPGLDDIVNMTIDIQSPRVTVTGFGTPLIAGYHARWTNEYVREYSSLAAMVTDGFASTDPEYKMAQAVFAGEQSPNTVKVGRLTGAWQQRVDIYPTTAVSTLYSFVVGITGGAEQTVSYTSSATANQAEIMNGLTAAIAALNSYSGNITASNQTTYVRIIGTAGTPMKWFTVNTPSTTINKILDTTADAGIEAGLDLIESEDADWYCLLTTFKSTNTTQAVASWVSTRRKMALCGTFDGDIDQSGSSDLASTLSAASYTRTSLISNDNVWDEHPDGSWAGIWLPYAPGSETAKFKTLTGVSPTNWTDSELAQLQAKNCNYYIERAGVPFTAEGVVSSGQYMDVIRFVDWLYARIQEGIFGVLTEVPKVPLTDAGLAVVEAQIRAVLLRGVQVGGLVPGTIVVNVPLAADITTANRAARNASPITFSAQLAGAVHSVDITGEVYV